MSTSISQKNLGGNFHQSGKRDPTYVALASLVSALTCQLTCHPFGVIGVRQQRAMRLKKQGQTPHFNPNSFLRTISFILKNEGASTFYNGFRYSVLQAMASSVCMLVTYETGKSLFAQKFGNNVALLAMASSVCSTILSTTLSFPLEYWKTRSFAYEGNCNVHNYTFGKSVYSAYFLTLQRQIIFFGLYWPIAEKMRASVNSFIGGNFNFYTSRFQSTSQLAAISSSKEETRTVQQIPHTAQIIVTNVLAGVVAGSVAAVVTQPLDVLKTRIQVFEEFKNLGLLRSLRQLFRQEGFEGLMAGIKPRILGVTSYGSIMLCTYETTLAWITSLRARTQDFQL